MKQQALDAISDLATKSAVTVEDLLIGSANNSHLRSLIASVSGHWSLDPYYLGGMPLSFALLRTMLLSNLNSVPYISCQANGQYELQQCVGTYDQQNTSSCFCVSQMGWEMVTTRVSSESGEVPFLNCSSGV